MLKIVLIVLCFLSNEAQAGNFLLLPLPVTSHCLQLAGIARELIKRGHEVSAYIPESFKKSHCFDDTAVKIISFQDSEQYIHFKKYFDKGMIREIFQGKTITVSYKIIANLVAMGNEMCVNALADTKKLESLKSLMIDISIIDVTQPCLTYVAKYLNTSTVLEGSYIPPGVTGPPQTHTDPFRFTTFTDVMNFPQRVLNTLVTVAFAGPITTMIVRYNSIDKTRLKDLHSRILDADPYTMARQSVLFLENSMDFVDYPKASYPNYIRVGGLTTRPAKPLSPELNNFFNKAKNGVIVVSFGSMLTKAPEHFFKRIVKIFQQFDQSIVMSYHINSEHGNVKTMSWLPQNDVLAHKNTILFVSHCGKNGFNEGLYHAVPIVCTPFHTDQVAHATKVKNLEIGTVLDLTNSDDDTVIKILKWALNEKVLQKNIERLSAIFHDAPFNPQEKAANALEHVLKFGGDHLRPASTDFNTISNNLIDVWFIIFTCLVLWMYVSYRFIKCCCSCVCRRRKSSKKQKNE
ncbi:hypothetical protein LOTGIDRAFT_105823 [Lottia gigantea]|uniref:UDP-glucuronosyltransferase n=1 Tax=Lottia gigantea TaxID=225164 RepID=V4A3U8_LOTGI|nr:hypothetical protein LOTGIDRAFT_105823 [Lottia gigantea]ESO91342.1 hypothetical protein LOTGIDRAFT_105823 [Lottia gigantea]